MSQNRLLKAFLTGISLAPLSGAASQSALQSDIPALGYSIASPGPSFTRQPGDTASPAIYNARNGQTDVKLGSPRADSVVIDGKLDEEVWKTAPVLTGFSQYAPVDGRPAPDSTEVRVWYSQHAIYFGIRAFEPHGEVRATLADRDRVSSDDYVEIHLDPFQEKRKAFVFIVNPLGIQADGTKSELGGYIPGANIMPGQNDLSADFIWQSHGRITDWGYEVEIRIPYNSLRFPSHGTQKWGIQFSRKTQHSGYETTWTPVLRGAASFIAQEGYLSGMTGLKRGVDLLINPELTSTIEGSPGAADSGAQSPAKWRYTNSPTVGGNIRAGLGSNFVLNGTFKPDFSQVEADATQVAADQRFALFYPERRPFFVEGSDAFNVPNTLVYTRTIVRPTVAAKLTGRLGRANLALLSAYDAPPGVQSDAKSLVNIMRITRDFSDQSVAGIIYSDRVSNSRTNRLVGADVRHVFAEKYYAQVQYATSMVERSSEGTHNLLGSLWEAAVDRTGRSWGFHYNLLGIQPDFRSDNGFVSRTGFVRPNSSNRITIFGKPGSAFEQYQLFASVSGIWQYRDFFSGAPVLEANSSAGSTVTFRHGWSLGYTPEVATYAFRQGSLSGLFVPNTSPPTPVTQPERITSFTHKVSLGTPQFQRFSAYISAGTGRDVDFAEAAAVRRTAVSGSLDWRPDSKLRVNATYASNEFNRRLDGRLSYSTQIPRVKVEYQMTRSVFVRVVSQYEATRREALRDWKTGQILLRRRSDGAYVPVTATRSNILQADLLFSYRPSPGTVFFAGYGSSMTEPNALSFSGLERSSDGIFVKLSWVMRAGAR